MSKLKPCPFCGGEASIYHLSVGKHSYVKCRGCSEGSPIKPTEEQAITAWNRRAAITPPVRTGRWIWIADGNGRLYENMFECSQCKTTHIGHPKVGNYCPNCGSKNGGALMRPAEGEEAQICEGGCLKNYANPLEHCGICELHGREEQTNE